MKRIQLKLLRRNDKSNLTCRYRWEILQSVSSPRVLLIERYGYKGLSAYAWAVQPSEVGSRLKARLDRHSCSDQENHVELSKNGDLADADLEGMLAFWSSESDTNRSTSSPAWREAYKKATVAFQTRCSPNHDALGAICTDVGVLVAGYGIGYANGVVHLGGEPDVSEADLVQLEVRVAGWGAW